MKRLMNWWLICGWVALTPTVFAASQLDSEVKVSRNFSNCRAHS